MVHTKIVFVSKSMMGKVIKNSSGSTHSIRQQANTSKGRSKGKQGSERGKKGELPDWVSLTDNKIHLNFVEKIKGFRDRQEKENWDIVQCTIVQ